MRWRSCVLPAVSGVVAPSRNVAGSLRHARGAPRIAVEVGDEPIALPSNVDVLCDPLPEGSTARLGSLRFRHGGLGVTSARFSPDGKSLITVGG